MGSLRGQQPRANLIETRNGVTGYPPKPRRWGGAGLGFLETRNPAPPRSPVGVPHSVAQRNVILIKIFIDFFLFNLYVKRF